MPRRTVRAIRRADGYLELLEPVELPRGMVISVTLEVPQEPPRHPEGLLPTRKLGPMKSVPTRDQIYAERAS